MKRQHVPNLLFWAGIDLAKATFDAALWGHDEFRAMRVRSFPRCEEGARALLAWLRDSADPEGHIALVMEATATFPERFTGRVRTTLKKEDGGTAGAPECAVEAESGSLPVLIQAGGGQVLVADGSRIDSKPEQILGTEDLVLVCPRSCREEQRGEVPLLLTPPWVGSPECPPGTSRKIAAPPRRWRRGPPEIFLEPPPGPPPGAVPTMDSTQNRRPVSLGAADRTGSASGAK